MREMQFKQHIFLLYRKLLINLVRSNKENKLSHMSTKIKKVLHPNTFGFVALILISQIGSRLIVDEIHSECGEALGRRLCDPKANHLLILSIS